MHNVNSVHFLFHHFPFRSLPFAMWRVLTVACGLVQLSCCQGYAETRVAVIASRSPGVEKLAPLLELELGKKQGIVLLEREHIKEVVREQELQALAAAEGTSKRIGLGKLLKADLLILLREQEDEQPPPGASDASLPQSDPPRPHARLVVCETRAGSAAVQPAGRADARRGSRRPRRRPPGRGRDREAAGAKRGHRGRAAACQQYARLRRRLLALCVREVDSNSS